MTARRRDPMASPVPLAVRVELRIVAGLLRGSAARLDAHHPGWAATLRGWATNALLPGLAVDPPMLEAEDFE